ncbi:hypothetical protein [Phaeobacter sp. J2-8]|uniref:hypothetical protein n=1 Tax=Phaeobacter sp. J2-8 TaxID=2931394 RepID=UPI001FCFCFA5|nr:hypothetical protein [Phaeobacter sp. J2-8]MCJ7871497.1 hypothetical protein [Phaeobacter sp. J2-8]
MAHLHTFDLGHPFEFIQLVELHRREDCEDGILEISGLYAIAPDEPGGLVTVKEIRQIQDRNLQFTNRFEVVE